MKTWLDELTLDDLPPKHREVAEIIGIANTVKLSEHFGGEPFYFTKLNGLLTKKKEDYIRRHFSGSNHVELARATGYSVRWVYEVLARVRDEKQLNMFEESIS